MTTMNLEISTRTKTQLGILKGKMLMRDSQLYNISDYKIEEVTETPEKTWLNKNPKPETKLILKEISVLGYNSDGRFLGTFDESTCRRLITYFDLYYFRNTWIAFNEQLRAFGLEVKEIKETKKEE